MSENNSIDRFLNQATRFLLFTGKGGVGKTSLACASAVELADRGKRVLLVSTDPASNLDEVLSTTLNSEPQALSAVPNLDALNIDPLDAAERYRERIVGPIRGVLPDTTVRNIEEQLSGACTTEIASFNEFSRLLGVASSVDRYDHVILDTAPTGHTLRLLALPAAWSDFIAENKTGSSCLGPMAGLADQRAIYDSALSALRDTKQTTLALVARADEPSLKEANRASMELGKLGIDNQALILNALFRASAPNDPTAQAMEARSRSALEAMPAGLNRLPRFESPYRTSGLLGIEKLRALLSDAPLELEYHSTPSHSHPHLDSVVDAIAESGNGVIMTMGKGGVGKTFLAKQIAQSLAARGRKTHLSTTDPANHLTDIELSNTPHLSVSAIDPKEVTRKHTQSVMETTGAKLDAQARSLLEEELRSPCTEEIAVFTAFAREVAKGEDQFVVLDTAPTGHTLLLLDATEAYHREVEKNASAIPEAVQQLLPRLRDPDFTKTLIVALPEATPVHEAAQLQDDLRRAKIDPFAWVVNQSVSACDTHDDVLIARASSEQPFIKEVADRHATRWALVPWTENANLKNAVVS